MAQALFANHRETNLASTLVLVEEVLRELGHDPTTTRYDAADALHAWRITKDSAVARVSLVERAEYSHIRVVAVVMTCGATGDRSALHAHLLEQNTSLCGAAFAADGNYVLVVTERSTLDLDRSEIKELIERVIGYADEFDDPLVTRFGGTLGED